MQFVTAQDIGFPNRQTYVSSAPFNPLTKQYQFEDSSGDEKDNKVENELNVQDIQQKDIQGRQSLNRNGSLDNQ